MSKALSIAASEALGRANRLRGLTARVSIWLAVIVLWLLAAALSPAFLSLHQVSNVVQVAAFLGVVSLGQTIALLVGGIDLSVGGVATLTNIVATSVMLGQDSRILPAILVCLLVGLTVGVVNGVFVAFVRVTPLISTLAMNAVLFGVALLYTNGAPNGSSAPGFAVFGQGQLAGIPASTICWLVVAAALAFVLSRSVFGRWIYATGANETAARLMGVPVRFVLVCAYALSGLMATLGGLLLTSYIGSPSLGSGDQYLLTSVAAAVVGGAALTGGIGTVLGAVGGALFITEANSFTTVSHLSTGAQDVVQGAIIAISVLVYSWLSPSGTGSRR